MKTEQEIRNEIKRLEGGIEFADNAIAEFEEDDMHTTHSFFVIKMRYMLKLKTLKWMLE